MKIGRGRKRAALLSNACILFCEIIGFAKGISAGMFVYYTNLSNLIAAAACFLALWELLVGFGGSFARVVWGLKYIAVCMTTVTLSVVVCILVPMQGFQMLYSGNFLAFHLVCPILMLVSFLFLEPTAAPSRKKIFLGIAPTLLYAFITVLCNCLGVLDGPYPFLRVREQPIYMSFVWGMIVLGIAWLIAYMLLRLQAHKAN